ncbi:hypothetical protein [Corynebacterium jeddahense]|uniref:Secreted protein n=1 Tax=Corynebacterium jeddahense TaxID=1414719 RepID=A0ABY7UKY4_9CORY|nr:hypothetical protein [Corynebacterium jeddahense]WCZ39335.1 hypothetical protein CJEDD_08730 [Corynebacterium jeddahense]
MRNPVAAAAVASALVPCLSVASLAAPAALAEPSADDNPRECTIEYTADDIPALAAGLHGDDILYQATSRRAAIDAWNDGQAKLKAGLGANGWGTVSDVVEDGAHPGPADNTGSSVAREEFERVSSQPQPLRTSHFSPAEVAFFENAADYTSQRLTDCGKDIARTAPEAPSSLKLALAPNKIASIVLAILSAVCAGLAATGMRIPGVEMPELPQLPW